jgi:hypothetical protein
MVSAKIAMVELELKVVVFKDTPPALNPSTYLKQKIYFHLHEAPVFVVASFFS